MVVELSQSIDRGQGQWALNTDLLRNTNFLTEVEKQWSRLSELKNDFTSKVEWWDRAKAMVKTISMIFSIHKKQIKTELDKTLEKENNRLQSPLNENENHSEHIAKEFEYVSKRLKNLMMRRSEGHRIRARIPNFEERESNIAYYSRMEKIMSERNMIYSIKDKNGTVQNSAENIIKVSHKFYSDLFKAGITDRQLQCDILRHTQKKLLWNNKVYVINS